MEEGQASWQTAEWVVGRATEEMGMETQRERERVEVGEEEREGDLQTNVHKQTDCQKRTGLGQTEGQINRRTDSAKANKQRQTGL